MTTTTRSILATTAIVLALQGPARGQLESFGSAPATDDLVSLELLSDVAAIRAGQPFWLAARLHIKEGWHVNWMNPGDAGLAPTVSWNLPDGYSAGDLQWPYPARFDITELSIFGYEKEVLLLSLVTPPGKIDGRVTVGATVDWLACAGACVPGRSTARLELKSAEGDVPEWSEAREMIAKARKAIPQPAESWKFEASLRGDSIMLLAEPPPGGSARLETVTFFPRDTGVIENAARQTLAHAGGAYRISLERARMSQETPTRIRGVLVCEPGWDSETRAVTVDLPLR